MAPGRALGSVRVPLHATARGQATTGSPAAGSAHAGKAHGARSAAAGTAAAASSASAPAPAAASAAAGVSPDERPQVAPELGLECVRTLVFRGWQPGGEYVKQIAVRNLLPRLQLVTFRSSKSTVFSLPFPEPVRVTGGMTHNIDVAFRPISAQEERVTVDIVVPGGGTLTVQVVALLPRIELVVPPCLDFAFVPVAERTERALRVDNTGEVPLVLEATCAEPFVVVRGARGSTPVTVQPHTSAELVVRYAPDAATAYDGTMVVTARPLVVDAATDAAGAAAAAQLLASGAGGANGALVRSVRVCGAAKFPFLSVAAVEGLDEAALSAARGPDGVAIDFGDVAAGVTHTRRVTIVNPSMVPATFGVVAASATSESVALAEHGGGVQAAPAAGTAGAVAAAASAPFRVEPVKSVVPPRGSLDVLVSYTAGAAGSFQASSFALRTASGAGVLLRACGRATEPQVRASPAVLDFGDVPCGGAGAARVLRVQNESDREVHWQLWGCDVGAFSASQDRGTLRAHTTLSLTVRFQPFQPVNFSARLLVLFNDREPQPVELLGSGYDDEQRPMPFHLEHVLRTRRPLPQAAALLFDDSARPHSDVVLQPSGVHFASGAGKASFSVRNALDSKITVLWPVDALFAVEPSVLDVAPRASASFSVTFRPPRVGGNFGTVLEGVAFPKQQRSFRLVDDESFVAPTCLRLRVSGTTLLSAAEQFVPNAALEPSEIRMPSTAVGSTSYATSVLVNNTDTPMLFAAEPHGPFAVSPAAGVVPPKQFVVLHARFTPRAAQPYAGAVRLVLNGGSGAPLLLQLAADASPPLLELANDGVVVFRPTAVGAESVRQLVMVNRGAVATAWRIDVPSEYRRVLSVRPAHGVVAGTERVTVEFVFAPSAAGTEQFSVPVYARTSASGAGAAGGVLGGAASGDHAVAYVSVMAPARGGVLAFSSESLPLGPVSVDDERVEQLTVRNSGATDVPFTVEWEVADAAHEDGSHAAGAASAVLDVSPRQGVVPAHSYEPLRVALTASTCGHVRFRVRLLGPGARVLSTLLVDADASLPLVQVADVAGNRFARTRLWGMVWADELNRELAAPLSAVELELRAQSGFDERRAQLEQQLPSVPINFSAGAFDVGYTEVSLMLEAPGPLPVEWALDLPWESEHGLERWAAPTAPDAGEVERATIMDQRLFELQPRGGTLKPGERQRLRLRYHHKVPGAHRLPALVRVRNGKCVLLELVGRTLQSDEPFVFVPSNHVFLHAVALGDADPPLQMLDLYNDSATRVHFTIDTDALEQLQSDSHGHAVLRCLQARGTIEPGAHASVPLVFSPLEERQYVVTLPVRVAQGALIVMAVHGTASAHESGGAGDADGLPALPPARAPLARRAQLSHTALDFGRLPPHYTESRLLVLRSHESERALSFEWLVDGPAHEVVSVEPSTGTLPPSGAVTVLVTVCSRRPVVLDAELVCVLRAGDASASDAARATDAFTTPVRAGAGGGGAAGTSAAVLATVTALGHATGASATQAPRISLAERDTFALSVRRHRPIDTAGVSAAVSAARAMALANDGSVLSGDGAASGEFSVACTVRMAVLSTEMPGTRTPLPADHAPALPASRLARVPRAAWQAAEDVLAAVLGELADEIVSAHDGGGSGGDADDVEGAADASTRFDPYYFVQRRRGGTAGTQQDAAAEMRHAARAALEQPHSVLVLESLMGDVLRELVDDMAQERVNVQGARAGMTVAAPDAVVVRRAA